MTREEAIKIIDCYDIGFYDLSGEKIPADKLADAFDMAIEALSAEAEPKWNCTANFVAEQLERLKDITDEERIKLLQTMFPSTDAVPQLRQTDTLIIADALRYLAKDTERHLVDRTRADALRQQFLKYGASMCKGGAE